jgi:hypothetical protein
MSARYSDEVTPRNAALLLDGHGGAPEPLARLLTAAAAPGRPFELEGEATVVAAFERHHAPGAATPNPVRHRRPRLLSAKLAALIAGVGVTGGIALAAVAFSSGSGSAKPAVGASPLQSYSAPPAQSSRAPGRSAAPAPPVSSIAAGSSSPGSDGGSQGAAALCRELAGQVASSGSNLTRAADLERALASSAVPGALSGAGYASLVQTAGAASAVPDYCSLLLSLPVLPQPADVTQIPVSALSSALAGLPAGTLGQILSGLPSSALSRVLGELPRPTESALLAKLPSSIVSGLTAGLPSRSPSGLPRATVPSGLPTAAPSALPAG